jgi:hypothetical protein
MTDNSPTLGDIFDAGKAEPYRTAQLRCSRLPLRQARQSNLTRCCHQLHDSPIKLFLNISFSFIIRASVTFVLGRFILACLSETFALLI